MKYAFTLWLVLTATSANAETSPCLLQWYFDNAVPLSLSDVPERPTVILPFLANPHGADRLAVTVRAANGDEVAGTTLFDAPLGPGWLRRPIWRPAAPLTPGDTYTLDYAAITNLGCGAPPIVGTVVFTVATHERPTPTVGVAARFRDEVYANTTVSRSCEAGTTPCEGEPGWCCAVVDPRTTRTLDIELDLSFDASLDPYYVVSFVPKTAELGSEPLHLNLPRYHPHTFSFEVDLGAPAPGPDTGCFEVQLTDLMATQTTTVGTFCADPARYVLVPLGDCPHLCSVVPNLNPDYGDPDSTSEQVAESDIADPAPVEAIAESVDEAAEPSPDGGCAGGATPSLLALVAVVLRRRR